MTLPDIPEDEYAQWRAQQFSQNAQRQVESLGFEHATNQQIASLGSDQLTNPVGTRYAPPEPPPPEPAPPAPAPVPQPEPPPPPEPPSPPTDQAAAPGALTAPEPQPLPDVSQPYTGPLTRPPSMAPPAPPPAPAPPPVSSPQQGDQGGDLFGSALTAAAHAGADPNQFAQSFQQSAGDAYSRALTAVAHAGGDVQQFASSFTPPPEPAQPAAAATPPYSPAPPQAGAAQAPGPSGYVFPVQGYHDKISPHWGDVAGGSDLFAARGTPVVAMRGGKVVESGWNSVGGNSVLIQGDDGQQYYYAHFDDTPSVKVGQTVPAGTYLGPVGDTGDAKGTGTHLHLGIGPDIKLGADKYGGTGGDYDAVSLLRNTLAGTQPDVAPVTQTTAGLSGGGAASNTVGPTGQAIMGAAAQAAGWLGDQGQKAVQAILMTEGGLGGARGDGGKSAGPLQFYEGGQLANFARQYGMTLDQAKSYVEAHPAEAVQWAIGTAQNPGYLGGVIATGLAQGLTGAALATYAQRNGQVSVSPERAGQNYNALFGGGGGVIGGFLGGIGDAVGGAFDRVGTAARSAVDSMGQLLQPDQPDSVQRRAYSLAPGVGDVFDQLGTGAQQAVSSLATVPSRWGTDIDPATGLPTRAYSLGGGVGEAFNTLANALPDTSDLLTVGRNTPLGRVVAGEPIYTLSPPDQAVALNQLNQQYSHASETATERINPAHDVPVLGGLINQATNPEFWLEGAGANRLGRLAEEAVVPGLAANRAAVAEAARYVRDFGELPTGGMPAAVESTLRAQLLKAGVEGAAFNTPMELQRPDATPESVGMGALTGLGAGAGLAGAGRLAGAGARALRNIGVPSINPLNALVEGGVGSVGDAATLDARLRALDAGLAAPVTANDAYTVENLMRAYEQQTPQRLASIQGRVQDYLAPLLTARGAEPQAARDLIQQIWDAGVSQLNDSRVTATGLSDKAAAALADSGAFTNKLNAVGSALDSARAVQGQVSTKKRPIDQGAALDFIAREAEADRMALGSTQALDEFGVRDPDALNRVYAYTTAGPPLLGPQKPVMWLAWEDGQPRVVTAHHHFGLGSPNADIHATTPEGLKALMWDGRAIQGDTVSSDTGDRIVNWLQHGFDVGGGRRIADTDALVGPSGENGMRMATALASMPQDVQAAIRSGKLTDPEQIASVLLRETPPQSSPTQAAAKEALGLSPSGGSPGKLAGVQREGPSLAFSDEVKERLAVGGMDNSKRTEALIVDPKLHNVKAIYLAGTPADLHTASDLANVGGRTRLQLAQQVRQQIKSTTGKDVPIIFKDLTPQLEGREPYLPKKLLDDAVTLEGPKGVKLAPGRSRIVRNYMAAGYPNAGFLPEPDALRQIVRGGGQPSRTGLSGGAEGPAASLVRETAKARTLRQLREQGLVDSDTVANMLGDPQDSPSYLAGVMDFLGEQRQKILSGQLTNRDVIKAYLMTMSSIRAKAAPEANVARRVAGRGITLEPGALSTVGGRSMVRPEDAFAQWLLSPEGKGALDQLEAGDLSPARAGGVIDQIRGKASQGGFGFGQPMMDPEMLTGTANLKRGEFNLNNISDLTRQLNEAGKAGDLDQLQRLTGRMKGIGTAKEGFVSHLLGLGDWPTVDTNELNIWLGKQSPLYEPVNRAFGTKGSPAALEMRDQLMQRFNELRDKGYGQDIPEEAFQHVMHHWLFDKALDAETTHGVMYDAQRNALVPQVQSALQQALPRVGLGAVQGGIGAGYQASQEPDATPESVAQAALGGAAAGAVRGGLTRLAPSMLRRAAIEEAPRLLDAQGNLMGKASEIEKLIRSDHPELPGPTQILGPAGELLSTIGRGQVPKFRVGQGLPIESIIRTVEGAKGIGAPSEDTLRRMPNLMHMANGDPDLQATIQRSADANPELFDKFRRGVITHDMLVNDLAPQLGMTAEQFMKNPVTRAYNDAELIALRATALDTVGDVTDAARTIHEAGGLSKLSPEDKINFVLRMNDAQQLLARAKGGGSNAARALNSQKKNITRELARSITSGNEAKAAQLAEQAANSRANRASTVADRVDQLQQERSAAVNEAQRIVRERTQGQPRNVVQQAQKDLQGQLKQINDLYDELGRYQSMSLAEKEEVFQQEAARRARHLAERADALASKEPDAVGGLLKSLQDELAAEKKHFAGSRNAWQDMAFWADKRGDILKQRGIEGQGHWLRAQAAAARNEAKLANTRAARAFMEQSRASDLQTEQASKILERLGGPGGIKVTDEVLSRVIDTMAKGDPIETANLLRGLQKTNWWNRVAILRYAGMLSASSTHAAQAVANNLNLGLQLASHPLAVGADVVRSGVTGSERQRYMAELGPMIRGSFEGLGGGFNDAREILHSGLNPYELSRNIENVHPGFNIEDSAIGRALPRGMQNAINTGAEAPLRVLEASDAFTRGMSRGAHTRGLATRQAINEGYRGAAIGNRADEIMANLVDHPELVEEADRLSRRTTFQERRSDVGALASRGTTPGSVLRQIALPFVRTPWNVAMQGVGLTPAGFLGAAYSGAKAGAMSRTAMEARQELAELLGAGRGSDLANADLATLAGRARAAGANRDISELLSKIQLAEAASGQHGGEFADRAARAMIGSMVMAGGLKLAADGNLTAGYPTDPSERSTLPEGWQPWAVRMPMPNGGHTYVKYNNLGGIGMPLGIAASMVDQGRRGAFTDPGKAMAGLVQGPFSYMTDTTMLQQLQQIMDAQNDPVHKGENFLEQTAQSFMPYGALGRQLQRAAGVATRDPQNVIEALEATYPGLSGMVQPKMDPRGRYVTPTQTGLGAFISPATYGISQADPTLDAVREARAGIPSAPQSFRNLQMTPQEQRQFQRRAGQYLDMMVPQLTQDPDYQGLDTLQKQAAMSALLSRARAAAGADIFGDMTDDELAARRALYQQAQLQRLYPPSEAS